MTATVDVLIAAFGRPDLLGVALDSVLAQERSDWRVLVSDDSASSAVRAAVEQRGDSRLAYSANEHPLGPAANHRRLLGLATSPFVAILNHDDSWAPAFLARLLPALEADGATVVAFCDHDVVDERGARLAAATEACSRRYGRAGLAAGRHAPFHDLVERQSIAIACAALFRRDALAPSDPPDLVGGAYDLWLAYRLAASGGGACYVPERLASWRFHGASLGERRDVEGSLSIARCWQAIADESREPRLREHARRQAASAYRTAALQQSSERRVARAAATAAWRLEPSMRSLAIATIVRLPSRWISTIQSARRSGSSSRHPGPRRWLR